MTILASEIVTEVSTQLNDINQVTWSEATIFGYINSAMDMIVSIRPDAYSIVTTMQMAAGSKQEIPATANRLLDIKRNMGSDGLTPGRAVLPIAEDSLDLFAYNWNAATAAAEIKNFSYDEKTPNTFYVDPPSDGTGWIEIAVSRTPTRVNDGNDPLVLKDLYWNHIVQWCMFRAYSIEVDSMTSQRRSSEHYQNFGDMMGQKFSRDVQFSASKEVEDSGR